jgi:hypothetical protein
MSLEREIVAADRRDLELLVERNGRLMQLARHNGFAIETRPLPGTSTRRLWFVPSEFVPIAGYQAAVVPA